MHRGFAPLLMILGLSLLVFVGVGVYFVTYKLNEPKISNHPIVRTSIPLPKKTSEPVAPISTNTKTSCADIGGNWISAAGAKDPATQGNCIYPSKDQGKACYQNSDCEQQCLSNGITDNSGYLTGSCGVWSQYTCHQMIPSKTKSRNDLVTGQCV